MAPYFFITKGAIIVDLLYVECTVLTHLLYYLNKEEMYIVAYQKVHVLKSY